MGGMTLASTGGDGMVKLWQANLDGVWHEQAVLDCSGSHRKGSLWVIGIGRNQYRGALEIERPQQGSRDQADKSPTPMDSSSGSRDKKSKDYDCGEAKEANSAAQHSVDFTEAEEDLVFRMHRLVGNRWEIIAGRIPGRTAEEVERFWAKKHQEK
ncbi:hypothetical protein U9M48_018393 [Paspalum notatum var. saurae]|uniref:Uncharacterized protein n=1 Tax=Paspalum notatum var. saurae TaxID=547442 RepID=A0AAQ3TDH3_PASNO